MVIDIRRALESLVPDAKWDFSIPNEGGTEAQYNAVIWSDARPKPAWTQLMSISEGFAEADARARRQSMVCGPLQLRKALRQTGLYSSVVAAVAAADEETQEAWEYASEVRRLDSFVEGMRLVLGKTHEEVDAIFDLAVTL